MRSEQAAGGIERQRQESTHVGPAVTSLGLFLSFEMSPQKLPVQPTKCLFLRVMARITLFLLEVGEE